MSPYILPTGLILMGIGCALTVGYLAFGALMTRDGYFQDISASRVLTVLAAVMSGVSIFFFVAAGKLIP